MRSVIIIIFLIIIKKIRKQFFLNIDIFINIKRYFLNNKKYKDFTIIIISHFIYENIYVLLRF